MKFVIFCNQKYNFLRERIISLKIIRKIETPHEIFKPLFKIHFKKQLNSKYNLTQQYYVYLTC